MTANTKWFQVLSLCTKSSSVTIQMQDIEQYFSVMQLITCMLYEVVLGSESVRVWTFQVTDAEQHFPVRLLVS